MPCRRRWTKKGRSHPLPCAMFSHGRKGKEWPLRFGVLTARKEAIQVLHDTWIAACVADANFSVTKLLTFLFGEIPRYCLEGVCFILSTVCAMGYYARRSPIYLMTHISHRVCPCLRRKSSSVMEPKCLSYSPTFPARFNLLEPFSGWAR
jgi:hypothetical protein